MTEFSLLDEPSLCCLSVGMCAFWLSNPLSSCYGNSHVVKPLSCCQTVALQRQVRHPFVHDLKDCWQTQRHIYISEWFRKPVIPSPPESQSTLSPGVTRPFPQRHPWCVSLRSSCTINYSFIMILLSFFTILNRVPYI